MKSTKPFVWLLLSVLAIMPPAFAEQDSVKQYPLHAYGKIELTVPAGWKDEIKQSPDKLPPTIRFTAPNEKNMAMLVTLLWPDRPDMPMPDTTWMKAKLEEAKNGIQPQAVEDSIPSQHFTGTDGEGYYFNATDSTPEKDSYKYMTHGMLRIGGVLASFTILTNDGYQSLATRGLTMLQNAEHHPIQTK